MNKKATLLIFFLLLGVSPCLYSDSSDLGPDEIKFVEVGNKNGLSQAQIYEGLGILSMRKQDLERAVAHFEKALELDDTLDQSWFCLGLIHMKTGNPEYYFLKNIELAPKYNDAYYWLAMYYCRAWRKDDSVKYFKFYLSVADRYDPAEQGRIKMANHFLKKMEAGGEADYNEILKSAPKLAKVQANQVSSKSPRDGQKNSDTIGQS